jgi:hypothetical protein
MGKNSALFLVDLFLYSYKAWFIKKMIKDKTITEVKTFNLTCRYIDDVLSINNSLHNIAEILLKLELNTNQSINQSINNSNWIPFTYHRNLRYKKQTQLPLPHFMTFTSNLPPVVNFLPGSMKKIRLQWLQTLRVKYSGTSVGSSNVVSKEKNLSFVSREKNSCLGRTTHPPLKS